VIGQIFSSTQAADFLPWIVCLISYLLGSIPFGLIIARIMKVKDLSVFKDGDIGATHITQLLGFWPAGFLTFGLDMAKGVLAVFLSLPWGYQALSMLLGQPDASNVELSATHVWAAGLFAVLGHCFSPWLHFRGGKGVATGLGVILILSPIAALGGVIGFLITFFYKRIVSLSSIAGLIFSAIIYLVLNPVGIHLWVGAAMLFLILVRHEANIDALLEDKEQKTF
jgi:glycerol-3-phosphate acyltransferase PlsY